MSEPVEVTIQEALFAQVATLSLSPALPVAWPNVSFDPPASGYLRVRHLPNRNRRLFMGSDEPHQREGILQIEVRMPLNQGPSSATTLAGKIAEHFLCDLKMWRGGILVEVVNAPDVLPAVAEDAFWFVPVSIEYQSFC